MNKEKETKHIEEIKESICWTELEIKESKKYILQLKNELKILKEGIKELGGEV